jgi:hypothetical protein
VSVGGSCFTNLDEFAGVDWPTAFVAVPRIGERVQGVRTRGDGPGTLPTLKVVGVTHTVKKGYPMILVELHR